MTLRAGKAILFCVCLFLCLLEVKGIAWNLLEEDQRLGFPGAPTNDRFLSLKLLHEGFV